MTDKTDQEEDQLPPPKLEDLWVMRYETGTLSEILKDWIDELLPRRKKKRKRP
jgi:hypothetical protein